MITFKDEVFGELEYDFSWRRKYILSIFGKKIDLILRVQSFLKNPEECGGSISSVQRDAFILFEKNKDVLLGEVEWAVIDYFNSGLDPISREIGLVKELCSTGVFSSSMVCLKSINFMYPGRMNHRKVGFYFDASFDRESGVGVLVVNESVIEVSTQDITI